MSRPDRLDESELWNLPAEAHSDSDGPFDPDHGWMESAPIDEQCIAMREWFLARYCDPAGETPVGRYGGYIFVNGGPYDPAVEIPKRFAGLLDDALIQAVVNALHFSGGDQWVPIHHTLEDQDDDQDELVRCA